MADAAKDDWKDDDDSKKSARKSRVRKGDGPPFPPQKADKDDEDLEKEKKSARKSRVRKADDDKPWEKDDDDDSKKSRRVSKADDDDDDDDDDDVNKGRIPRQVTGGRVVGRPVRKADDDDDDDDDDYSKSDDDDDDDDDTKKSGYLNKDTLRKSLKSLSSFIRENSPESRRDYLLSKAQKDSLSKSERRELGEMYAGGGRREPTLSDRMAKSMDDDNVNEMINVSEYIASLHGALNKSLDMLTDAISAMDARQQEFDLLSARAMHQQGSMIKSMNERLEVYESTPARGPKSQGVQSAARPLNKSFRGEAPGEDTMSKSEVLDTLTAMNEEAWSTGRKGLSKSGHDLTHAAVKYESTGAIDPAILGDVAAYRRGNR